MTKDKILEKHFPCGIPFTESCGDHENDLLHKAMDEYAKAFADWIRTEKWNNRNGYDWCRYETIYSDISVKTTEELYSQFIEQQTENK